MSQDNPVPVIEVSSPDIQSTYHANQDAISTAISEAINTASMQTPVWHDSSVAVDVPAVVADAIVDDTPMVNDAITPSCFAGSINTPMVNDAITPSCFADASVTSSSISDFHSTGIDVPQVDTPAVVADDVADANSGMIKGDSSSDDEDPDNPLCKLCEMPVDPERLVTCETDGCNLVACISCMKHEDAEVIDNALGAAAEPQNKIKCPTCVADPATQCSACNKYISRNVPLYNCRVCTKRVCIACNAKTTCCDQPACIACIPTIEKCGKCDEPCCNRCAELKCNGCKTGCRKCTAPCPGCRHDNCKACRNTHGSPCEFCAAGHVPDIASIIPPAQSDSKSRDDRKKIRKATKLREAKWAAQIAAGETEEQTAKRLKDIQMFIDNAAKKQATIEAANAAHIQRVLDKAKADQVCNRCNGCNKNACFECVFPCPCCGKLYCPNCHYVDCGACGDQLCCRDCNMHKHMGKCIAPMCEMPAHDVNTAYCKECRKPFDAPVCCEHIDLKLNMRCNGCLTPVMKKQRKGKDGKIIQEKPKKLTRRKQMPLGFRKRQLNNVAPKKSKAMLEREEAERIRTEALFEKNIPEEDGEEKENNNDSDASDTEEDSAQYAESYNTRRSDPNYVPTTEDVHHNDFFGLLNNDNTDENKSQEIVNEQLYPGTVKILSELTSSGVDQMTDEERKIHDIKEKLAIKRAARKAAELEAQLAEELAAKTAAANPSRAVTAEDLFGDAPEATEENSDDESDEEENGVDMPPLEDPNWQPPQGITKKNVERKPLTVKERHMKRVAFLSCARPLTSRDRGMAAERRLPNGMTMDQMQQFMMEKQLEEQMMAQMKLAGKPPVLNDGNNEQESVHVETDMTTVQA